MKCMKCGGGFPEDKIHESHDIPCYLFYNLIGRKLKKQEADKYSRHHLYIECHEKYEKELNVKLIQRAIKFSEEFYG